MLYQGPRAYFATFVRQHVFEVGVRTYILLFVHLTHVTAILLMYASAVLLMYATAVLLMYAADVLFVRGCCLVDICGCNWLEVHVATQPMSRM